MSKSTITLDQLRQELFGLNLFGVDALVNIEAALQLVKTAIETIEADIERIGFTSSADEIYFFRHVKPHVYAYQIAFTKIRKIELLRLAYSKKEFKGIVKQKLAFIQAHYIDYPEFTRYYSSSSTHDDERYFLRSNRIHLDCFPISYNDNNSTGYDLIASYLLAYQFLINHFDQDEKRIQIDLNQSELLWSLRKVDFVELISGLHAMASINRGENDLKTLCLQLGKVFNIDIKDIYGKRREIKERKGERFKFIRQMLDTLERDFDENFE